MKKKPSQSKKSKSPSASAGTRSSKGSPKKGGKGKDIISVILLDHKPLWKMIKVMKSEKVDYKTKQETFKEFAPTLLAHAKPEEKSLYESMKAHEMVVESIEGDVEHGLADQLCEELKSEGDEDTFMAKVKVLAELVEHHLKEEEEELFPQFKKESSQEEREELAEAYLEAQAQFSQAPGKNSKSSSSPLKQAA